MFLSFVLECCQVTRGQCNLLGACFLRVVRWDRSSIQCRANCLPLLKGDLREHCSQCPRKLGVFSGTGGAGPVPILGAAQRLFPLTLSVAPSLASCARSPPLNPQGEACALSGKPRAPWLSLSSRALHPTNSGCLRVSAPGGSLAAPGSPQHCSLGISWRHPAGQSDSPMLVSLSTVVPCHLMPCVLTTITMYILFILGAFRW